MSVLCTIGLMGCGDTGGTDRTDTGTTTLTTTTTATTSSSGGTDTASSDSATSSGTTSTSGSATDATTSTSSTSSSGGSGVTGDPPKFDLGVIPDAPIQEEGCQKVDFLFIIDNSGSMATSQANVVANFPAFINGIQSTLTDVDEYQVGVVTSDKYEYNDPNCQDLGSLVIKTGGSNSSMATCGPYANGLNFMTEADDLSDKFTCAATLGTQGGGLELPMMAMEETVSKVLDGPGNCNEDFLRDDALLVIVIITDEADGPGDPEDAYPNPQNGPSISPGTPQSWFDSVVASKANIEENVVVLSLINWYGGPCMPQSDFFDGQNIKDFTELFTYGFVGGICEPDYGPIFNDAISVIADACENFTPPG